MYVYMYIMYIQRIIIIHIVLGCVLCVYELLAGWCREEAHLVPVNYARPASHHHHRQNDGILGRLKVTVAQVLYNPYCTVYVYCPHTE